MARFVVMRPDMGMESVLAKVLSLADNDEPIIRQNVVEQPAAFYDDQAKITLHSPEKTDHDTLRSEFHDSQGIKLELRWPRLKLLSKKSGPAQIAKMIMVTLIECVLSNFTD